MTRSKMLKLLKEGKDPLDISIQKWTDIVKGKSKDEASINCALCYKYSSNCGKCPIAGCYGTPYTEWANHQTYDHPDLDDTRKVKCPTCLKLAKKELAFLRKLKRRR